MNWMFACKIILRDATVHRFMHHSSWLHNLWPIHKLTVITSRSIIHLARVLLTCDISTNNTKSTWILNLSVLSWIWKQTVLYWTSVLYWVILHSIVIWWSSKLIYSTLHSLPTVLHSSVLRLIIIILRIIHAYRLNCFERCLICGRVWNVRLFVVNLLSVAFWAYRRRLLK